MRKFLFLIMIIPLFTFGQSKIERQKILDAKKSGEKIRVPDSNYHDASSWCKIEHKCTTRYRLDDFEQTLSFSDEVKLKQTFSGQIYGADIHKMIKETSILYFISFSGMKSGCVVTDKTSVKILLKNGEKIDLPFMGKIDCGKNSIWVNVGDEIISKLLTESMDKIRLQYSDGYEDFEVTEKGQEKFFNKLKCIVQIQ